MPSEAFRKGDRVRKRSDFRAAQSRGSKVHTLHFLFVLLPRDGLRTTRLGITVTKKVSSSAVGRNRVKRVVREVFRRNRGLFPEGCDIVAIAKRGAPELGYTEVKAEIAEVEKLMRRRARR